MKSSLINYQCSPNILKNKNLLITGSTDGIGRALAIKASKLGAQVILHGKNKSKLENLYDEIKKLPGAPCPSIALLDLANADENDYINLAKNIEGEFGKLDGLVHNAAILGNLGPIEQYDPAEWQMVIHINLTAPFVLTQVLLPCLKQAKHSSIIFTTSGVGKLGKAFWGAYSVSKFGIEGLNQILAEENKHKSLRVNCIDPGPVNTKMRLQAYPGENRKNLKNPDDILPAYIFLLGDDSMELSGNSYILQQ